MPIIYPEPQEIDGLTCWIMPYYSEHVRQKYAVFGKSVRGWQVVIECGREFNNLFVEVKSPSAFFHSDGALMSMPHSVELTDKEWSDILQQLEKYRVLVWLQDGDTYTIGKHEKYEITFVAASGGASHLTWNDASGLENVGVVREFPITQHWIDDFLDLQQFLEDCENE